MFQGTDEGDKLKNFVMRCKPNDMKPDKAEASMDFLTVALLPDQTQRASTSELLNHCWLAQLAN